MAGDPPSESQTLIENHINRFNTQNVALFLGVFGDEAIIIDGIAPYRWLNPNAPITNARLGQRLARLPPWPSTLGGLPRALKQQGAGPFIGDWTAKRQPKALGPSVLSRVPISG